MLGYTLLEKKLSKGRQSDWEKPDFIQGWCSRKRHFTERPVSPIYTMVTRKTVPGQGLQFDFCLVKTRQN